MKTENQKRRAYADSILEKHSGEAYEAYLECYSQLEGEPDLQFIERCAHDLDYWDGESDAACFQEIYDELQKEPAVQSSDLTPQPDNGTLNLDIPAALAEAGITVPPESLYLVKEQAESYLQGYLSDYIRDIVAASGAKVTEEESE